MHIPVLSCSVWLWVLMLAEMCLSVRSTHNSNHKSEEKLGSGTSRSYFNGFFRRFAFPPKTFLIFIPELTLPAWRDRIGEKKSDDHLSCDIDSREGLEEEYSHAVKNSDIQLSSPFYVYFDKLGFTHKDSIYNTPAHTASFIEEYLLSPARHLFGVPPGGLGRQDISRDKRGRSSSSLSDTHRLQIFRKIETLIENIGAGDGRSCLLRAICELHEFQFESGRYGIFGEVLSMIFGALPQGTDVKENFIGGGCLSIYAKAEKHGKAKDCSKYTKYCQQSIFQWYWKIPFNKIVR